MFRTHSIFRDLNGDAGAGAGGTAAPELAKVLKDTGDALVTVKAQIAALDTRLTDEALQRKREIDALVAEHKARAGLPGYTKTGNPDKDFSLGRAILGAHKKWAGETKQFPEYTLVHEFQDHIKAMTGDVASAGGFLVSSTTMMEKFIEELLAQPVALAMGVDQITGIQGGDLVIPGELGGITVTRGAEASAITESAESYKDITLRRKQFQGLAKLSLSLMRQTNGKVMGYVEKKLSAKAALRQDLDFFTGSGAENVPLGIIGAQGVQAVDWNGTDFAGADQTATDKLESHVFKLKTANAYRGRVAWACHPGVTQKLRTVKDANGNPVLYRPVDLAGKDAAFAANFAVGNGFAGMLYGHPLYETTQLTGSGAGSHLFLINASDCAWAVWDTMEIAVSEHADFNTGKVNVRVIGWQDSLPYRGVSITSASNLTV